MQFFRILGEGQKTKSPSRTWTLANLNISRHIRRPDICVSKLLKTTSPGLGAIPVVVYRPTIGDNALRKRRNVPPKSTGVVTWPSEYQT